MKQYLQLTALVVFVVAGCKATIYNECKASDDAYITEIHGFSGDGLDKIYSFFCNVGGVAGGQYLNTGGLGGDPYDTSDAEGYTGFKSGYWTSNPQAASGFSPKKYADNQYLGPYGRQSSGVTDKLCSGGSKMKGISASRVTGGSFTAVGVDLLPICTTLKYECPGVVVGVSMNSGGGVDKITGITCLFGDGTTGSTTLYVGGDSGGPGIASGGPFTGFKRSVFNSASTNMLSGLIFKKLDGSTTAQFGSDTGGGALSDQDCPTGQVITGFYMPQAFYNNWHLVGSGLAPICGCQSIKLMPKCTTMDSTGENGGAPTCKCKTCDAGYAVDTTAAAGASTSCMTTPSPTPVPTPQPTVAPTAAPTDTVMPTAVPTATPLPTAAPTKTRKPTAAPTTAVCTCLGGVAASGSSCPTPPVELCASCNAGYYKTSSSTCVACAGGVTYKCPNGSYQTGAYCDGSGTFDSQTCKVCGNGGASYVCPLGYAKSTLPCDGYGSFDSQTCQECHYGHDYNCPYGYKQNGTQCPGTGTQDTQTCTAVPTPSPTSGAPTNAPTSAPTPVPTSQPTIAPTNTVIPTAAPTSTTAPTKTKKPTQAPTAAPTPSGVLYACAKGSIMENITIGFGDALYYISSFDCIIPSSFMIATTVTVFTGGTPGVDTTVQGPFTAIKVGYYVTSAGVITDGASGVQFIDNRGTTSQRYGSSYTSVKTKKCAAGEVIVGFYITAASGGPVAGNLTPSCAAPPTKNYQCGTGAIIDTITLYAGPAIAAITQFTCKDSAGTITKKTPNLGTPAWGSLATVTGPFIGFSSGYAVAPISTDTLSGLMFIDATTGTGTTYGTPSTGITSHQCAQGQKLYGLTIGLDSTGATIAGKMSPLCRA